MSYRRDQRKRGTKRNRSGALAKETAKNTIEDADEEELALEDELFGSSATVLTSMQDRGSGANVAHVSAAGLRDADGVNAEMADGDLFTVDRSAGQDGEESSNTTLATIEEAPVAPKSATPAWFDPSDDKLEVDLVQVNRLRKLRKTQREETVSGREYSQRLREQFAKANAHTGVAGWSQLPDGDAGSGSEGATELMRSTASMLNADGGGVLPAGEIRMLRLKDANHRAPSNKASIQSVRFMRRGDQGTPLMLTAGFDKTLRLFSIDGKANRKVQSTFIKDMPIHSAEFSPTRDEIIMSGRRSFFYAYDLNAGAVKRVPGIMGRKEKSLEKFTISPDGKWISFLGNDGYAIMVDGATKRWVHNLKINGSLRAVSFAPDSRQLYASGGDGRVYLFDLRTRRCINQHADEGCIHSTALASSSDFYACGSSSGIVNIYSRRGQFGASTGEPPRPGGRAVSPIKSISSLVTRTDVLRFSPDGQILAVASQMKKDALRLVHVASGTVFSNWPTSKTPLRYVTSLDFSPAGGLCAIGNDRGRVLLYRMLHYNSA